MTGYERVKELFDYDPQTGVLSWRHAGGRWNRLPAGRAAGTPDHHGHLVVNVGGETQRVQRVIWLWMPGEWPEHVVDHKNRVRHDNRWVNLRDITQGANAKNVTSRGVSWDAARGRWHAQLKRNYVHVYRKRFVCFGQAVNAYKKARKEWAC